ncbi:hypothetical protein DICPUDRAFT_44803 [Dictyostelium purpureum]|uniref:Twinfilin n=1 Tax=Dictyostelium purpureum TaxID=5786 RepID=F0Z7K0_DICPU|nr:uncharacterized protein DICPUDRAFT_44803 [Dictyostelium purpureum]EGC40074.1 hypothetical protein DICPUDRAFT_44803 [Dictyostelium purpureum]|eukprot:XP_003283423.1 hypothetical protein DICPUDRAFT_44803 [Dictyostelium purpureum]
MSHSSGIPASPELIQIFGQAQQDNTRYIKVVIKDDQLVVEAKSDISGDFESDLDSVPSVLDKASPCYILYKRDDKSIELTGYNWIFMFYVPDIAKVREKMTYASTRANLKRELGASHFVDEIYSSKTDDFNKKGYQQHKRHQESEAPLTWDEMQRNDEREGGLFVGGGGNGMHVHGISFPVEDKALSAINDFVGKRVNYVELALDIQEEKVIFGSSSNIDINDVSSKISTTEPRFHFFRYSHNHEGDSLDSIIYVFSCPDGSNGTKSAPVRKRMLYSSSKANVEQLLTKQEVKIDLKLEINSPSEISADSIINELHPPKVEEKKAFSKPARPGQRKLIK